MRRNFEVKDSVIVIVILLAVAAGFALTSIPTAAQSGSGKPAPRLSNGKPDFTGTWDHPRVGDVSKEVKGRCAGETAGFSRWPS